MKPLLILLALLAAIPVATALQTTLTVTGCTATICNTTELNAWNNVSGMNISKNGAGNVSMSQFAGNNLSTITNVSFLLSHDGDSSISGSWTITFWNETSQAAYCSMTTPLVTAWTVVNLTPTGCAWTPAKLADLGVNFANGDTGKPATAYVDYFDSTVVYSPPPVQDTFVRYTYVSRSAATIAWDTNNAANSTVEYGTTTALGTTLTNTSLTTNHSATISGLAANTLYYYNVTSCDGNTCNTSGPYNLTTYQTLQVATCSGVTCSVSGVNSYDNITSATGTSTNNYTANYTALGQSTATIQNMTYRIDYSTQSATVTLLFENASSGTQWCSATLPAQASMTYAEVTPTGCAWTPARLDQLSVVQGYGATDTSSFDFTAALVDYVFLPQISGVRNGTLSLSQKQVNWTTLNAANGTIQWGNTTALGNTLTNTTFTTTHQATITGLLTSTTYYYNITSCTTDGCETVGPYSFTTPADLTPIISNVQATNITDTGATITWTTSAAANSSVDYGNTSALGTNVTNATQTTTHSIAITGLNTTTTYYYNVTSCNSFGCKSAGTYSFITAPPKKTCTYIYTQKGSDWKQGMLSKGDVVRITCRLPTAIRPRQDLTIKLLFEKIESSLMVQTPRLFVHDPEAVYP